MIPTGFILEPASGVYDDPESPLDAGNSTSLVVGGLESGVTYYFAVSAVDKAGNESDRSEETKRHPHFCGRIRYQ